MSIYATKWAYAQPVKPAGRKFVLVAIADFADAEGRAFPGVNTIATMTGQDERSVRRHIDALEEAGYLQSAERRRKDGSRTTDEMWLLAPPEALLPPSLTAVRPPRATTGQNARLSQPDNLTGTTGQSDWTNRTICHPSPDNLSGHEPSLNHHFEPSPKNTLVATATAHALSQKFPDQDQEQPTGSAQPSGQPQPCRNAQSGNATSSKNLPGGAAGPVEKSVDNSSGPQRRLSDSARLVGLWNDLRGPLPAVESLTEGRKKSIRKLLADCDGNVERAAGTLADAIREVARDPFWLERRYGFDNLVPGKVIQKAEAYRAAQPVQAATPAGSVLTTAVFQPGQRVSYKREAYTVENVTDTFIDLYDDVNGSSRVLLASSDWSAVRVIEGRA